MHWEQTYPEKVISFNLSLVVCGCKYSRAQNCYNMIVCFQN